MSSTLDQEDPKVQKQQMMLANDQKNDELTTDEFKQERYRWVIVALVSFCLFINSLANNAIIPIANKIQLVYDLPSAYVNSPITASLFVYSISNIPANHIIDTKGLRVSFLIGTIMYSIGLLFFTLINQGYFFVLIGSVMIALGQPFIINCPAKAATYWFMNKNRTLATSLMIASNLFSIAISFMCPTLFVREDAYGEDAKDQIFYLYAVYTFVSVVGFIMVFLFMRKEPKQLPSLGAETKKSNFKESMQILRKDRNLWRFFTAYVFVYGTMLGLGSCANLLFKPYGFTDIQIGISAVTMLILGVLGSIIMSLYIKKTNNYKKALRTIIIFGIISFAGLGTWLQLSAQLAVTIILIGVLGFFSSPIITLCYDLGCELAFPMGEAQVTGILNGSSLFYTFIVTLIISAAVGFGSKSRSLIIMLIFMGQMLVGCFLFFSLKIILKRKDLQSGKLDSLDESKIQQLRRYHHEHRSHSHPNLQQNHDIRNSINYRKQSIQMSYGVRKYPQQDSPQKLIGLNKKQIKQHLIKNSTQSDEKKSENRDKKYDKFVEQFEDSGM